jgi:hypothetical protein
MSTYTLISHKHKNSGGAGRIISARVFQVQIGSVRDVVEIASGRGETVHVWFRRERVEKVGIE